MKKGAVFTTIGSIIILIISFIAFILPSSLGSAAGQQEKQVFGKYKNKQVVYEKDSDFVANLQAVFQSYQQNYGREPESNMYYDLYKMAFENTIAQFAYEDDVKASGYVVSEEAINRKIRAIFEDENGDFDYNLYRSSDSEAIKAYKTQMMKSAMSNRFTEDLFGSNSDILAGVSLYGIKESDAELNFLQDFDMDKRAFNLVAFKKSDYPSEEIVKFAKSNTAKFNRYDMSIITFEDKSAADKAVADISKGTKTFEDVATETGSTSYKDAEGKLAYPYYYQYRLENLFSNKADVAILSGLALNEVSSVIELNSGYAIFKRLGDPTLPNFEDEGVIKDVSTYLNTYEGTMIEEYYINLAKTFIDTAKASDFDAACAKMNLTKTEVPEFSMNFGNSSFGTAINSNLPGLKFADTNETFLKTAFTLKDNEISSPMVMRDDASTGYVIVIQYTPKDPEPTEGEYDAKPFIAYQISTYDKVASQNCVMKSKFVVDDFFATYYGIN